MKNASEAAISVDQQDAPPLDCFRHRKLKRNADISERGDDIDADGFHGWPGFVRMAASGACSRAFVTVFAAAACEACGEPVSFAQRQAFEFEEDLRKIDGFCPDLEGHFFRINERRSSCTNV